MGNGVYLITRNILAESLEVIEGLYISPECVFTEEFSDTGVVFSGECQFMKAGCGFANKFGERASCAVIFIDIFADLAVDFMGDMTADEGYLRV